MKKFFLYFISMLLFFLLQTTVFQWLSLAGVAPNLLVILAVTAGLLNGSVPGIFCGLACGLIVDCMYGNVIGLCALFYMLDGYLAGIVHRFYSPQEEEFTIPLLLIGAGDLIYNILYYVAEFLMRNRQSLGTYFMDIMLPEMIYTLLSAVFFYKLILLIHKKIELGGKKEES